MKSIHFILQGKGGVGKSVIASLLTQFFLEHNKECMCFDTDPINSSFSGYNALNARKIDIGGREGKQIDSRKFDVLVEASMESFENMIVDNGASSFVAFSNYFILNNLPSVFVEQKRRVVIHTVVTGGQAFNDTVMGTNAIIKQYPVNCTFILWLNPFFGELVNSDGIPFLETAFFKANKEKIAGLITLPTLQGDIFGLDFEQMLKAQKTFNEVLDPNNTQTNLMTRHRIGIIKEKIYSAIQAGLHNAGLFNECEDSSVSVQKEKEGKESKDKS